MSAHWFALKYLFSTHYAMLPSYILLPQRLKKTRTFPKEFLKTLRGYYYRQSSFYPDFSKCAVFNRHVAAGKFNVSILFYFFIGINTNLSFFKYTQWRF